MPERPKEQFKKLHKLSPVFMLTETIKDFFLLILIAVIASSRANSYELWAIAGSCIFVLYRMIWIRFFKYALTPDELIVKKGIFFKQERYVPYERIQNINETQGVLHRFFNVSKVTLESASGLEPEAVFNVISKSALQELRMAVRRNKVVDLDDLAVADIEIAAETDTKRQILFMPSGEVIKHGLVTLQGLVPLAIFWGLLAQQEALWDKLFQSWISKLPGVENLNAEMVSQAPGIVIGSILILLVMGIFVFCMLSIFYSLLKFYNFTLSRDKEKLLAIRGLLTKQSSSTSIQRIQKINLFQGILHRLFKRVTITCKTAGNSTNTQTAAKFDVLAPLLETSSSHGLLQSVFPELNWSFLNSQAAQWVPIPYRSWKRMVKWKIAFFTVISLIAAVWVELWVLFFYLPALVWSVYSAQQEAKAAAFIYHPNYIVYRSGWLSKNLSIVPMQKSQAALIKQNIFDLRHKMASFTLDTAGLSPFDHSIDIRYLEWQDAINLLKQVTDRTNKLEFEW